MWKTSVAKLSSCLIVENDKGNVFILDNEEVGAKSEKPQSSRSARQKARQKAGSKRKKEPSPITDDE